MRRAFRELPRAARLCALVAGLNALAWSLLTPPFHVPDENAHFAYVQQIGESGGKLPRQKESPLFSNQEEFTLGALEFYLTVGHKRNRPIWFDEQESALERVETRYRTDDGQRPTGTAGSATYNPPLYYALATVPYALSPSEDLVDRLALMRLVSVLLAPITTLLVFLFLREVLPRRPWAWTVGALAVAFQPLFGFLSGGVNNDDLLVLAAAAAFLAVARVLRRGLTPWRGVALGAVVALGLLAKPTFVGLVPGVALGLLIAAWRLPRREALGSLGAAAATAGLPVLVYVLLNATIWDRPLLPGGEGIATGQPGQSFVPSGFASYLWQFYLPRIPGLMADQFPNHYPAYEVWFKGFVGRFGWLDTEFPLWVYQGAAVVAVAIATLAAVEMVRRRASLRARLPELATYAAMAGVFIVMLGLAGFRGRAPDYGFEQARYLLPLLPLYGGVIALAARAAGRRGPVLGATLVVLLAAHTLFSGLLVISRYYG